MRLSPRTTTSMAVTVSFTAGYRPTASTFYRCATAATQAIHVTSTALKITRKPHAFGVYPLAVQRGRESSVRLVTSALKPDASMRVSADLEQLPRSRFESRRAGWSTARLDANLNPVQVLISEDRQVQPAGTHTSREKALNLQLPIGVSARFNKPGLQHFYRFSAMKDGYYRFEVNSERRGFAVDSVITVLDTDGRKVASGDDGWFTKDAKLDF